MNALFTSIALKALDGLSARAEVTAENIANANTQGFRRRSVSFESALATAAQRGPEAVSHVKPSLTTTAADAASPGARLDLDLATASSTAGRYSALIEVMGRQMQLEDLVLKEGR